jgi:hypothetical protein
MAKQPGEVRFGHRQVPAVDRRSAGFAHLGGQLEPFARRRARQSS